MTIFVVKKSKPNNNLEFSKVKDLQQIKITNKKFTKKHYSYLLIGSVIILILLVTLIVQLTLPKVKVSNTIKVDYTGTTDDGKVFDTSVKEVGLKAGLNRPDYQLFEFKVGSGQVIQGFDEAVIGMGVGEKKTVIIPPEKAYGQIDNNKILQLNKDLQIKHITELNTESYKRFFNEEPLLEKEILTKELPWKLKVIKIQNNTIFVENAVVQGQKVILPGTTWESVILNVGDVINLIQNPKVGDMVSFPTQQGFVSGKVSEVSDKIYKINTNHPLAGKTLTFEITVKEIKK